MGHSASRVRWFFSIVLIIFLLTAFVHIHEHDESAVPELAQPPSSMLPSTAGPEGVDAAVAANEIPNIVHYVWILKPGAEFSLGFKQFVSIYSSHLYLQPEKIYIHSDCPAADFERARTEGNEWTQRILSLPGITYNQVEVPETTTTGRTIVKFEHKSDFVRTEVLARFGGLYLDTDAIPLRDMAELRRAGFANVVGMEVTPTINNGVMMCRARSILVEIYRHEQHQYFDGDWATASTKLLAEVAFRLAAVPSEVLIMEKQAFQLYSWRDGIALWTEHPEGEAGDEEEQKEAEEVKDKERAMAQKPETVKSVSLTPDSMLGPLPRSKEEASAYWASRPRLVSKEEPATKKDWRIDSSAAYVLHAFDNGKFKGFKYEDLSLEYVLRRRSNYARAVYPAMAHAIEHGIIKTST